MSATLIFVAALFQAAPPPIVLRDHAPAPAYDGGFVAHCPNFRASLARRGGPSESSLHIEVAGHPLPREAIDRIKGATPIMKPETAPTILCGTDSVLIAFLDGVDEYGVLVVGHELEAITRNNRVL